MKGSDYHFQIQPDLKAARVEKGLTMQQLTDILNVVGTVTISKYESGKYNISVDLVDKICTALDVEQKILFEKASSKQKGLNQDK